MLANERGGALYDGELRVVGRLMDDDVALIIIVYGSDGNDVFIVGPNGTGWTQGGLLRIIKR